MTAREKIIDGYSYWMKPTNPADSPIYTGYSGAKNIYDLLFKQGMSDEDIGDILGIYYRGASYKNGPIDFIPLNGLPPPSSPSPGSIPWIETVEPPY